MVFFCVMLWKFSGKHAKMDMRARPRDGSFPEVRRLKFKGKERTEFEQRID